MRPVDLIALADAQFGRATAAQFKHGRDRFTPWHQRFVERFGRRNAGNRPISPNEHHVERDQRVFHPERDVLRRVKGKNHPLVAAQRLTEHQAILLLPGCLRNLDIEAMDGVCRTDCQGHVLKPSLGVIVDNRGGGGLRTAGGQRGAGGKRG